MTIKQQYARALRELKAWGEGHRVGDKVIVHKDDGTLFETTTRSEPEILSGHTAVIWVHGIAGCYKLSHVRRVSNSEAR